MRSGRGGDVLSGGGGDGGGDGSGDGGGDGSGGGGDGDADGGGGDGDADGGGARVGEAGELGAEDRRGVASRHLVEDVEIVRRVAHFPRRAQRRRNLDEHRLLRDEAFLDLSGTERLHGGSPARTLARLAADIHTAHGITVTVGLSHNKFLAKMASGLNKPHGFTVIGVEETIPFLAKQEVSRIWGVGKVFQRRLEKDGITTIAQLQEYDGTELVRRYGEIGGRLARLSRGEDSRKVTPGGGRKSFSSETTFREDLSDPDKLKRILWWQAEKVSAGVKKEGIGGRTITLKLKTSRFRTLTRSRTLPHPTPVSYTHLTLPTKA